MDALLALTNIAVLLLLGLLCSLIAQKLKMSNVLLLVLLGVLLGNMSYQGESIFHFDSVFLVGLGVLALVMIVFDGSSRFRLKEVGEISVLSLKLIGLFMFFSIISLTFFTNLFFFGTFEAKNIIFSIIFSVIVVGTDPGSVFAMLKNVVSERVKKVVSLLEIEAILNTPIIVIIPFILLGLIETIDLTGSDVLSSFVNQIPAFFSQIIVGVGAGVIVGLVVLKAMKNFYSSQLSPVGVITAALMSYVLAENLSGNGVLAVASLGLLFGNVYLKEKVQLQEFNYMLSSALEILVFVMTGMIVTIPLTFDFFIKSIALFVILIISRMLAVFIGFGKKNFSIREKLFISLNMPKGIAVAVVVFTLSLYSFSQMDVVLRLILAFMIYSLILSTIVNLFSKKFIKVDVNEKAEEAPHPKLKNKK
jgi:NhaP-type Na+/H+ or K+/H+ antiporter